MKRAAAAACLGATLHLTLVVSLLCGGGGGSARAQTSAAGRAQTTALVRQARWLERSGRIDRAAALLLLATRIDPTLVAAYLDLSTVLARLGRHDDAIAALRRGLGHVGAGNAALLTRLGYHLEARGKLREAWSVLERARRADLSAPAAALLLGEVGLRLGYWSKAASALRAFIVQGGGDVTSANGRRARLGLALALLRGAHYADARRHAAEIIAAGAARERASDKQRPHDVAARVLLAAAQVGLGQCRQATAALRALSAHEKALPSIAFNIALCHWRGGKPQRALATLARYARLRKKLDARALLLRARLRRQRGDARGALADYARAAKLDPRGTQRFGADPLAERAALLVELGRADEAQTLCQRALRRAGASKSAERWRLLALWGRATLALGQPADVVTRLSKLVSAAATPRGAEVIWVLGRAHRARDEHGMAAQLFATALRQRYRAASLDPLLASLGWLARRAYQSGNLARAEALLQQARRAAPSDRATLRDLALVQLRRDHPKAAVALLEPLAKADGREVQEPRSDAHAVAHLLGRAYAAQRKLSAASTALRRAVWLARRLLRARLSVTRRRQVSADLLRIRIDAALLRARRGKIAAARNELAELAALRGPGIERRIAQRARHAQAVLLLRSARARIAAGAAREALEALGKLAKSAGPLSAAARCALGVAYAQLGERRRAASAVGPRARACVGQAAARVGALWLRFIDTYARLRRGSRRVLQRAAVQLEALARRAKRRSPRLATLSAKAAALARQKLALRYFARGRMPEALAQLRRIPPGDARVRHDRLVAQIATTKGAALRARAELRALAGELPRSHIDLAALTMQRRDARRALSHLQQARRVGVRHPQLATWISRLSDLLGVAQVQR